MIRVIVHVLAVIFLLLAAFKATWGAETVVWLYLGLAAWCASMLPWSDWGIPARRRQAE